MMIVKPMKTFHQSWFGCNQKEGSRILEYFELCHFYAFQSLDLELVQSSREVLYAGFALFNLALRASRKKKNFLKSFRQRKNPFLFALTLSIASGRKVRQKPKSNENSRELHYQIGRITF